MHNYHKTHICLLATSCLHQHQALNQLFQLKKPLEVPPDRYHGLYCVKILVQFCQLLYHCIRLNTLSCRKKNWSLQLLDPSINPNVNRPPGEESVGKLVEPIYAKTNSFIGASLASTTFIPLSLMHEAIPISPPRSESTYKNKSNLI